MRAALALVNGSSVTLVQKALRVVTGHGNTNDYLQASHTNAGFSGGTGGGSIFGGGINAHTSADARNAKNFNESHQSQNDMSYSEASGIVKSYANSVAHSNANSEVKSSADKYLQSVEQSETLGTRKSALEQELHSMTESFSKNRSIGMSTKMSLHDDAREELVQSLGVSHEEANRMINKNTPEAQSAFEKVYDQKQHSTQNKPMVRQSDWSIKNSGSDLRKQYASSEKTMNENMAKSQSKMKYSNDSSVKQKVANKNGELNKTMNAGRQKINEEKEVIKQGVNERAKDGTAVTVGKQIWNNATKLNPFSDKKE